MNKFVIYTAIVGGYDEINQPEVIDNRFDYVLFSNDIQEKQLGVWQVRRVDYANPDKTRIARYVKTHPEELLPEYEATLWMDANIQILSSWVYTRFLILFNQNVDVASIKHPERDCIYDEGYTVSAMKFPGPLEHDCLAVSWLHKIWKDGYPRHYGLFETNVLFRRHNAQMKLLDDYWWGIISVYSKRDQLSFNYVLWKLNIKTKYFLPNGENVRNSSHFKYCIHAPISIRKFIKLDFWERLRYRLRYVSPKMEKKAEKQWHMLYRLPFPSVTLWFWGFFYGFFYSPILIKNLIVHRMNGKEMQN